MSFTSWSLKRWGRTSASACSSTAGVLGEERHPYTCRQHSHSYDGRLSAGLGSFVLEIQSRCVSPCDAGNRASLNRTGQFDVHPGPHRVRPQRDGEVRSLHAQILNQLHVQWSFSLGLKNNKHFCHHLLTLISLQSWKITYISFRFYIVKEFIYFTVPKVKKYKIQITDTVERQREGKGRRKRHLKAVEEKLW